MTEDLIRHSAREVVARLATGDLSPHEALDAVQARVESVDQRVFGKETFNLHVEQREECLRAILNNGHFDADGQPESVRNLSNRYQTIVHRFPGDLVGEALPYFSDWLQHRVLLVDIVASDQGPASRFTEP